MTFISAFPRFSILTGVAAAIGLLTAATPASSITTEQLTSRMNAAISGLQYLRCSVKAQERLGSEIRTARSQMKLSFRPVRIYIKNDRGVEVLYVTGQNGGDAWVYPAAFPYVTLSLSPEGNLMRKGQHHSVLQAGFGTITDLLRTSGTRIDNGFTRSFRYTGDSAVLGRSNHVLRADFPQFRYLNYKIGRNETVKSIAEKYGCGPYRIMEKNGLAIDATLTEGKTILVPNAYGKKIILCVDPKSYLPTVVQVNDDRGLYEKFEFTDVTPNQTIPKEEFAKGYKGYKL
jgi:Protein of unknown function (DUF1571)/LysM domain